MGQYGALDIKDEHVFFCLVSAGRTVFTSFLKSEFSEENMDFWVACEDYKKISPSKRASRARQIYQQYVEADAPREVRQMVTLETSQK